VRKKAGGSAGPGPRACDGAPADRRAGVV